MFLLNNQQKTTSRKTINVTVYLLKTEYQSKIWPRFHKALKKKKNTAVVMWQGSRNLLQISFSFTYLGNKNWQGWQVESIIKWWLLSFILASGGRQSRFTQCHYVLGTQNIGIPCFVALCSIVLHWCVFYKLKTRPSSSKKIATCYTCFTAVAWTWIHDIFEVCLYKLYLLVNSTSTSWVSPTVCLTQGSDGE